jgi:bla regulator protein blaR1
MSKRSRGNLSRSTKALLPVFYVAAIVGLMAHGATAQDASKSPAFDVATIKPAQKGALGTMMSIRNGIVDAENMTVPMLIRVAYGLIGFQPDDQVVGAPDWAKSERYDILAKMSDDDAAEDQKLSPDEQKKWRELMLQALLAERFKLKLHHGTRQVSDYELVVAKSGLKLKPITDGDPDTIKDNTNGQTIHGSVWSMQRDGTAKFQQYTMEQFATFLTHQPGEPGRLVVDKTGLTGKYSFTLNWSLSHSMMLRAGGAAAPGDDMRSLFTVLQEELGLRLQPSTGTVETLIIDHLERPSEN